MAGQAAHNHFATVLRLTADDRLCQEISCPDKDGRTGGGERFHDPDHALPDGHLSEAVEMIDQDLIGHQALQHPARSGRAPLPTNRYDFKASGRLPFASKNSREQARRTLNYRDPVCREQGVIEIWLQLLLPGQNNQAGPGAQGQEQVHNAGVESEGRGGQDLVSGPCG